MNSTVSTTRPPVSTTVISANLESNGHMLDELLAEENKVQRWLWIPSILKPSSRWFTQSHCLGVDDNDNLMYSLTRAETWLLTTGALVGFTVLVSLLNWLI